MAPTNANETKKNAEARLTRDVSSERGYETSEMTKKVEQKVNVVTDQDASVTPKKILSYASVAARHASDAKNEQNATTSEQLPVLERSQVHEEWGDQGAVSYRSSIVTTSKDLNPQQMLQGQGSWKPIEVTNVKAARRAVNKCRVGR